MEERANLGKYIQQKRKEAGLTQKALAEQLCVTESAVSKWERNLSYPDITLVTSLCTALGVTEHELLTASDDMHQREIEKQSRNYLRILTAYNWVIYLGYAAALISTFIWGLASKNGLWVFLIVLASLCVAFSLINLPTLVKRYRPQKVFWSFYASIIFLLAVCRLANVEAESQHWLLMAILGVSLGLLGVFLPLILRSVECEHPIFKHKGLICVVVDSVLIYLLVFFGCWFYASNENVIANNLTVTTFFAIGGWAIFLICRYTKLSRLLKGSIAIEICGWFIFLANSISDCVFDGIRFSLLKTFSFPTIDFSNWGECANANIGIVTIMVGAAMIVAVVIRDVVKNRETQSE